ncbi:MAG: ABC transporter substrate-binding protein [Prolixibacteraceae bacterium]|nr:ABC transporter substrate-binding protein [Prolixibacteraceae bacterium]
MKNLRILILCVLSAVTVCCSNNDDKIKIGYVQIVDDPALNIAKEELFTVLSDSGYVDKGNIKIIDCNAQGDMSMLPTIFQSLKSSNVDMIITCGTPCMVSAAQMIEDIPVVFTVAFSPEQVKMKSVPSNLYGTYDPLNASGFVSIIKEILPDLKRIGMPYNNSEPNAEYSAGRFSDEFANNNIEVEKGSVTNVNDLVLVGQSLAAKDIDAFIVSADNVVCNALNVLIKIADENDIPLFVTDESQVYKGASVGHGVSYKMWGNKSGLKAVEILKGREVLNKIEPITEEGLIINKEACAKQGLQIPESIIERADSII